MTHCHLECMCSRPKRLAVSAVLAMYTALHVLFVGLRASAIVGVAVFVAFFLYFSIPLWWRQPRLPRARVVRA